MHQRRYIPGRRITWFILVILCLYSDWKGKKIFSCDKEQIPCLPRQQTNSTVFFVMRCSFVHNLEQRQKVLARSRFPVRCLFPNNLEQRQKDFARGCEEKYSVHGNISQKTVCYQKKPWGVCVLPYENSLGINFKKQWRIFFSILSEYRCKISCNSPPWFAFCINTVDPERSEFFSARICRYVPFRTTNISAFQTRLS